MPRGAAGNDDHALGVEQLLAVVNQSRQRHVVGLYVDTATHAVSQAIWLFKDLLQHEVRIAAFLYLSEIYVHLSHVQFLLFAKDADDVDVPSATDDGDIAVF